MPKRCFVRKCPMRNYSRCRRCGRFAKLSTASPIVTSQVTRLTRRTDHRALAILFDLQLFDRVLLYSPQTRFVLAGIINRMDRLRDGQSGHRTYRPPTRRGASRRQISRGRRRAARPGRPRMLPPRAVRASMRCGRQPRTTTAASPWPSRSAARPPTSCASPSAGRIRAAATASASRFCTNSDRGAEPERPAARRADGGESDAGDAAAPGARRSSRPRMAGASG